METIKVRYESPELEEIAVNAFAVIAGATSKIDQIEGDAEETELLD